MKIEVTTKGQELLSRSDRFSKALKRFRELIDQAVIVPPHELLDDCARTPVDTGRLRESIGTDWAEVTSFGSNSIESVPIEVRSEIETQPAVEQPNLCENCRNYHGQSYNGNFLVCGMHPYGWAESKCPDWEAQPPAGSEAIDPITQLERELTTRNLSTLNLVMVLLGMICQNRGLSVTCNRSRGQIGLAFNRGRFSEIQLLQWAELEAARSSGRLEELLKIVVDAAEFQLDRRIDTNPIEFHPRNNNLRLQDW